MELNEAIYSIVQDPYPPAGGRQFPDAIGTPRYQTESSSKRAAFFDFMYTMFTVYILFSEKYDKIYIGYTSDLENRLESHNHFAKKGYTIRYRPWKVIHTETFNTKKEAMKREKQLKSAKGRAFAWNLVKQFIQ